MRPDLDSFATVREAIALAGPELPDASAAVRDLDAAEARHRATGNHTVAALVGGTGSGKSALFNAITGTDFADAGHARPSTRHASACAWGRRAEELLDFLGVEPARRLFQDTLLEREGRRPLDGLVLLDLPDHDSVDEDHAAQVDRLLPVVDVLIWVVDPQKYADHLLHEVYLRRLLSRSDAMVLVLNQVDTLDDAGRAAIVADIHALLEADQLGGVPVLQTNALTGEGGPALRDVLTDAVQRESTADRTAAAAVDGVARTLLRQVGPPAGPLDGSELDRTVEELMRATGVAAVASSITSAVARWGGGALAAPQKPSRAAVAAIGSHWAGRAKQELPASWSPAVDRALPGVEELRDRAATAVASVPLPPVEVRRAVVLGWGGVAAAVVSCGLLATGVALPWPAVWLLGPLVLAVLAALLLAGAHATRAAAAADRAATYERDVRRALADTTSEVLAGPTRAVLERHGRVGTALAAALRPSTGT